MEFLYGVITAVVVGFLVLAVIGWRRDGSSSNAPTSPKDASQGTREVLYELARQLQGDVAHPNDLISDPAFTRGVRMLSAPGYARDELLGYVNGNNEAMSYMALEALAHRRDGATAIDGLMDWIGGTSPFGQFFMLRVLQKHVPVERPLVGEALAQIAAHRNEGWLEATASVDQLRQFVVERLDAGEQPRFALALQKLEPFHFEHLGKLITAMRDERLAPLRAEIDSFKRGHIDHDFLKGIGRIRDAQDRPDAHAVIEHAALLWYVEDVHAALTSERPRSVLLIGESGVGKGAIVTTLAKRLQSEGWTVFEAGSPDVLAGQKFVGELEERIRELMQQLDRRRKVLWVIPNFHQLAWAGRHQYSPVSILDLLLPHVENGDVLVLGKTEPSAYERLIQARPSCSTALVGSRVAALSEKETLALALQWAESTPFDGSVAARSTIVEAWRLAQQYLGDKAAPGNLLHFLALTLEGIRNAGGPQAATRRIETDDLVVTLAKLTGLPTSILDERIALDLQALRRHFEARVLGQREAVECLVERVAMVKAHVTDPTRPLGVFLFAGPTGTGKTEIAKSLAEFLFGSPDRMIRLDMSEFQSEESLRRIFGTGDGENDRGPVESSLVDAIRKQPFSVVLLDEFEKAHVLIWDVFLQVFDDGRLTDRRGNLADFRQAVIILTSNLGGLVPTGTSLGFSKALEQFQPEAVKKTVERSFRREFVNRIDRIVVFHPLARETMREILVRELDAAFQRRGLRNRGWAVEWEDAAVEFLLEKGFTADMGARPLKRAIERYLLAPLAMTIVNHKYPKGDQFLFVSTQGDRLRVQFVDPDLPATEIPTTVQEPVAGTTQPPMAPVGGVRLEDIVLQARGVAAEIECLRLHVAALEAAVGDAKWQRSKLTSLELMSSVDFWNSPTRFGVLGEAEYQDRIEAGVERSASLLQRLAGDGRDNRRHYPVDLVQQLGQQLFLLRVASEDVAHKRPRDAFLLVEPSSAAAQSSGFGKRLGDMYQAWARRRRMQCSVLEAGGSPGAETYRLLLAVSGYGAYSLLAPESGLHVHEVPEGSSGRFRRHQERVRVIAQPDEPVQGNREAERLARMREQAYAALRTDGAPQQRVVRRYRDAPSPLVRDSVRGWRTGRIDQVLAGNFDLFTADSGGGTDA